MLEEQKTTLPEDPQPPAPAPQRSNGKWILLGIGGGCSLLACAAVIAALAGSALYPFFRRVSQAPTAIAQQVPATIEVGAPTQQPEPNSLPTATMAPQQPARGRPANTMGDPHAPVKIVEYADFQCPYCMRYSQQTEPQIIDQYVKSGKVFYEYRSVGAFLGPESGAAAQAAYCAGDQGKFWEYHNTLFANWTGENVGDFTNDNLQKYAASLGLDKALFNDCLSSGKYASRLDEDMKSAQAAGVRATPSFVINGRLVEGALPFADFQQVIESALQGK